MARKRAEQEQMEQSDIGEQVHPASPAEANGRQPADANEPAEREPRQYPPEPNPRSWARHAKAGVQLLTHRDPYEAALIFQDKPSPAVIDFLKESGFRWNGPEKAWTRPVNFETQAQDRLIASRTYHKVVNMILEEKGLAAEPERTPF